METAANTKEEVFAGVEAFAEQTPVAEYEMAIQGGRERGLVLHKLLEEVLSGETPDDLPALTDRASALISQLGLTDQEDASTGPSSGEMALTVQRTLQLAEIVELRPRLLPEFWVYRGAESDKIISLTAGIADAIAFDGSGQIETVIDWKSDVDPAPAMIEQYRAQVRDYLAATGASLGLIVFMTSSRVERVV
jgi:exodeoxyribonuclease-5